MMQACAVPMFGMMLPVHAPLLRGSQPQAQPPGAMGAQAQLLGAMGAASQIATLPAGVACAAETPSPAAAAASPDWQRGTMARTLGGGIMAYRCEERNCVQVVWEVEKRKFKTSDKQIVSTPFSLSVASSDGQTNRDASFKLMIQAKPQSSSKGKSGWKTANGSGSVLLKCETDLGPLSEQKVEMKLRLGIGAGVRPQDMCEVVLQDFTGKNIHTLGDFVFGSSSDQTITLDVLSAATMSVSAASASSGVHSGGWSARGSSG